METLPLPRTRWISPAAARLATWECTLNSAVAAARNARPTAAHLLAAQALALSQALFDEAVASGQAPDDHLGAFVVTRLTLADLYRQAGQIDLAAHGRCAVHRALIGVTRNAEAPLAVRQAAFRLARQTHAALLAHVDAHGCAANVLHALRLASLPLACTQAATLH